MKYSAVLSYLLVIAGLLPTSPMAFGEAAVVQSKWKTTESPSGPTNYILQIPLRDILTSKQTNMIKSGFSAITTITLVDLQQSADGKVSDDTKNNIIPLQKNCSVKFDTWLETFDYIYASDVTTSVENTSFDSFAGACLQLDISDHQLVQQWQKTPSRFMITLAVKQISETEAEQIREWLVQQQSGMMQGLFSHMLGDLALSQSREILVSVPALPKGSKIQ